MPPTAPDSGWSCPTQRLRRPRLGAAVRQHYRRIGERGGRADQRADVAGVRRALDEERKIAKPLLFLTPALFLAGTVFGYYLVLPAAVHFLLNFNADQFNVLIRAKDYYSFFGLTVLSMGVLFELPLAILIASKLGGKRTPDKGWAAFSRPEELREGCEHDLRELRRDVLDVVHVEIDRGMSGLGEQDGYHAGEPVDEEDIGLPRQQAVDGPDLRRLGGLLEGRAACNPQGG